MNDSVKYKFYCYNCRACLGIPPAMRNTEVTCLVCNAKVQAPYPSYAKGTLINNFKIDTMIGEGSMGEVYSTYHEFMDRWVAIKIIKNEYTGNDSEELLRFRKEIKTLAKFNHPNIVSALFADQFGGKDYLVMNYVEGMTLADILIKEGPFAYGRVLLYSLHIAKALKHAWDRGELIHRDIKPHNIMLDQKKNIAVLIDLGIARNFTEKNNLTQHDIVLGSPIYMSPEQGLGEDLDCRSDMYSLGATMYHLVSGQLPYEGKNSFDLLQTKKDQKPIALENYISNLPLPFIQLIYNLMECDRKDRPESWNEVIEIIKSCIHQTREKKLVRSGKKFNKFRRSR